MIYAYIADTTVCKHCVKGHYYLTNHHIVVVGTREELEHVALPFEIEAYDSKKSNIKECMNIFGHYPELDNFTRKGILRNMGQSIPGWHSGYGPRAIDLSEDKQTITYKRG